MFSFTKTKFLSFPIERQHKKCCSMLRHIYDLITAGKEYHPAVSHYNELQGWMGTPSLEGCSLKNVSDRFHQHSKQAGVSYKEHNLLPRVTRGDRAGGESPWPIAIYLDHIRSAHNVGSILRTVECLRLGTVFLSDQTPHYDHKQVKDASMGTSEYITCQVIDNLDSLPRPIIALETSPDATSIHEYIFPETFTLVVGNEEYGCSDEVLTEADQIIAIPMRGRKNSLNAANAFSMAAHEIARQRQD